MSPQSSRAASASSIGGLPDATAQPDWRHALEESCNREARARPLSAVSRGMFDDIDNSLPDIGDSMPLHGDTLLEPGWLEAGTISFTHLGQAQPNLPASRLAEDQRRMQTTASVSTLSQQSAASRASSQLLATEETSNKEDWDVLDFAAELVDDVDVEQVMEGEVAQHVPTGGKPRRQLTTIQMFACQDGIAVSCMVQHTAGASKSTCNFVCD